MAIKFIDTLNHCSIQISNMYSYIELCYYYSFHKCSIYWYLAPRVHTLACTYNYWRFYTLHTKGMGRVAQPQYENFLTSSSHPLPKLVEYSSYVPIQLHNNINKSIQLNKSNNFLKILLIITFCVGVCILRL